jgi:mannan endo-1,4-beta-mannosidase
MAGKIKTWGICLLIAAGYNNGFSQAGITISVDGTQLRGPCGDTLLLKGVNYAPYNWGWSPGQLNIGQIALTGANCIRLPWYVSTPDGPTPQATYNNLALLDSTLSKCIQNNIIPILELHDETCQNDPAALIALANWYVRPAVRALINQYRHSLVINIANEPLFVDWAGNPAAAQTVFVNTYTTILTTLRGNGITVPVMIDGPECGTNLDVLADVGATLEGNDPAHNTVFSAHAYWYSYAGNDSGQMLAKVNYALSKNIPFVFGEVANLQDEAAMCQYSLNYRPLLNICRQKKIGWLAWSWDNDGCPARQLSANGNFSNLTAYGADVVNNPGYGLLANPAAKSLYLSNDGCATSAGHGETSDPLAVTVYPNPSPGWFAVSSANAVTQVKVLDISGRQIKITAAGPARFVFSAVAEGVYLVKVSTGNGRRHIKRLFIK